MRLAPRAWLLGAMMTSLGACAERSATSPLLRLRDGADSAAWENPTPLGPPTLLAAGDVAKCDRPGDDSTAALLDRLPGTILALGDLAYQNGRAAEFATCYAPTWGRHRARTRPAPGNHEYGSAGAAPYFAYFGARAGPIGRGYYSFDVGGWHIVSLNSNAPAFAGSPQERWLRADLASHPARCTLAYWHHPRFSSGPHGDTRAVTPLWQRLDAAGADVVLAAHDHLYERFAPLDADGRGAPGRGLRSFVVGTGGAPLNPPRAELAPGSEVRLHHALGVLALTLLDDAYRWEFIGVGGRVLDAGEARCR